MHATLPSPPAGVLHQITTTVIDHQDDRFQVRADDECLTARRAVSCLVQPEVGDLVLLAVPASGTPYILAVLERPWSDDIALAVDGDLSVTLGAGRFQVSAAEGITMVSPAAITVTADQLNAQARQGRLAIQVLSLIAQTVNTVADRISQRVRHAFRRVEMLDHLRAGQVDYASDGLMRLHSQVAVTTARELVKTDARQIHIG